jgi:Flp pilus assembly protein TadB
MSTDGSKSDPPARRTRTAEIADAITDGAGKIGRLAPQQVLTIIAVGILGFVCSLQAFQTWNEREERREVSRERQEAAAIQLREQNAQAELTRQHCASEATALRAFFSEQNDKRMRFETEERAKDRAVLTMLSSRLADLERAIGKKVDE